MARYFSFTPVEGMSNPKLDSQGCANLQFKLKNVTGAGTDAHAALVSLPVTNPPSGAVQNGWVKIDGPPEQHFEKDQEKTIVVKIAVPKKDKAKPGNYQFRLDVSTVAVTDQGDSSPVITFTVPETKPVESHFPMWLIPVIAVVVIGLGVGLYLLLKPKGPTVPDLQGKTVTEATAALTDAKLTLDSNVQTVDSKPENSGKIVDQTPKAGDRASQGQSVQVTVGAPMVSVPRLVGLSYQDALRKLTERNLAPGDIKTIPCPNFAGGVVCDQSPGENQVVKGGTQVSMRVTPQTVAVQSVAGQTLVGAINMLRGLNLDVGNFSGDTNAKVVSQSPASGMVPLGTKVDLVFPNTGVCARAICFYQGSLASRMALETVRSNATLPMLQHTSRP
jgi:beta-lactam-binding protein with PASTA domain